MPENSKKHPSTIIPGEAQLYQLMPKGWTLLSILGMAVFGTAFGYFEVTQHSEDITALQEQVEELQDEVNRLKWRNPYGDER